ncbi:MAG: beta-ketoacyl-ACP synthase 3 [Coleofasciculaceae cyanobacterium SM2_1_6]|nr:beta-ketoacyl-ACP synthase 3 [Coleofasciculaceae cyanobacterium SM2_1_6]
MNQTGLGLAIIGCGSATPQEVITNDHLTSLVDTSDEWISTRTGIRSRRVISETESLSQLAHQAAIAALDMAKITPADLDLIILATSTPDDLFGSANQIQASLGATHAVAFDLTAACSGFVFGLVTAAQFMRTGVYRRVLLIGADVLSRWVDWSDRGTCILFGDGAGAVVLEQRSPDQLLGFELRSNGSQRQDLTLGYQSQPQILSPEITVQQGGYTKIFMNGKEVYKFAVQQVPEIIEKALFRANITVDQVDWLLLHQANQRILDAVSDRLKIPSSKVLSNLRHYGNTSAASIPLALDEAVRSGKVKPGDVIATAGFGAGLTWGAAIFKWG